MNLYFYLRLASLRLHVLSLVAYRLNRRLRRSHRLVFCKSIHLEVGSDSFCFLINSSWLLVFAIILISLLFTGFNLYCWSGIHFS